MRLHRFISFLAVGTASVLLAAPALAQTTGGLSGQIIDAGTQQAVADAVVIAQSPKLQGEQTAVSDATGSFEITLLPPGVYSITVQREGYNAFTQQGLTVGLDRTIKIKLQLVPDTVQAGTVEIVAQKPTIAVTSASTGQVVSKEQMELIPYGRNSRNFEAVATSVPGVHGDQYGLQVGGATSPESSYIIDGVSVNDPAYGTQGTTLIQDFVQEVDVKTGGYQAEYGRATGGVINVITKSGSNDFHGSAFADWSPFEATRKQIPSAFAITAQQSQNYNLDFGAELGGPIIKDKLWFYAGFAPQFVSRNTDRIIQAQQDNGAGGAKLGANGAPLVTELGRQRYTTTNTTYQFTGKLTYQINQDHNLSVAVYGNPSTISGGAVGNGNEGAYLLDQSAGSIDGTIRYQGKLFNKSMLVEANLGVHDQSGNANANNVTPRTVDGVSGSQLQNTPGILWLNQDNLLSQNFQDGTVPSSQQSAPVLAGCMVHADGFNPCPVVNYITGGPGFLEDSTLTRFAEELKLTNFVEFLGHHQFKYGVNFEEDKYNVTKQYTGGQFFYAITNALPGGATYFAGGGGFGHSSTTNPSQPAFDPNSNQPFAFQDSTLNKTTNNLAGAFFAQDTWSILDKVVVDAGVRVEYQHMSPNKTPASAAATQDNAFNLTSVMPRLGVIYDPTGRGLSKIYASFGQFYEYIPLDLADRDLSVEQLALYNTNGGACTNPKDPRTCQQLGGYGFYGGAVAVDPNMQAQYTNQFIAGGEYQIYRDISLGVSYTHTSLGRVVEDLSVNNGASFIVSNPGEPGKLGNGGTTPSGQFVQEPPPERIYDALTLSLNKQFADNYLVTASYTYSALRGNYPGLFTADYQNQLDPNLTSEYDLVSLLANKHGPLPGDIPNAFKLNGAYAYEFDSDTTANLGLSLDVRQGGPTNYLGAGNSLYGTSAVFVLPRGSGDRLPWETALNARLGVNRKLSKDYTLGVSVDAFNLLNQQATTSIDQNYTYQGVFPIVNGSVKDLAYLKQTTGQAVTKNLNFGQPTSFQLPFSMRLGAKLSF